MITFSDITKDMTELYERKNKDYGNSFDKTLNEFGIVAGLIRLNDKMNRIKSIYNKDVSVKDESLEDTLIDLANYAVMTLMWINNKNELRSI